MTKQKKNRLLIVAIFSMSIIPVLMAWGLKENISLLSPHRTNKGELIIPPVTTDRADFVATDTTLAKNISELPGHWLIVNVIPQKTCNAQCLKAIVQTKQIQLMLNKDLLRTRRVVLAFETIDPATAESLWLKEALLWRLLNKTGKSDVTYKADQAQYDALLKPETKLNDNLIARLIGQDKKEYALESELIKITPSPTLQKKIAHIRKGVIPDGLLLLIDPLGNVMMQYDPGFDPYKVESDLKQLLRISQIG